LSDPAQARTPVSAIAYEMGFGSLGPFNRAFKGATGLTPTEWRRKALIGSPNSEISG
jgi:AraC-like DNA-binding protein